MDFNQRFTDYFRLSISGIEKKLHLSSGYISNYRAGKIKNPSKLVWALKQEGLSPDYFLSGEGPMFLNESSPPAVLATAAPSRHGSLRELREVLEGKLVPFLTQMVSAGPGAELQEYEDSCGLICLPEAAVKGELRALRVKGDSMEPTLRPGDIVVCDLNGWQGDGVYVIRDQDSAYVKRVRRVREGLEVISDNVAYKPWSCPSEELVLVGRVVFCVVRL